MKNVTELTKNEVIKLILLMKELNQRTQAEETYRRENARRPEWNLFAGIREAMGAKA